ncbi:MAG: hypothetical protein HYV76_01730 [Candidatus Vogelbacteria bacterium]|nr:hypothetical protein [Candidatus Vogelbacteria bacterium]
MQTGTEQVATRPFHETILEAIRQASSTELKCLATLIKATKVPKGHDEIVAVWNERRKAMCWDDEDLGVPANLLEQKQANAKKTEGEKKGINLDDLQQETEKLLSLLKDRQPGLMTWNEFMQERLQNLHKLAAQALGK